MRIRKPTRIEIILIILLVLIIGLPIILLPKNERSAYRCAPVLGYSLPITKDITSREEYISADIDGKMDVFYNALLDISENGYDLEEPEGWDYYDVVIDPDMIFVDRENRNIYFYEQCDDKYYEDHGKPYDGGWYRYDFNGRYLTECNVNDEIFFFVSEEEFINADIDTQMDMLYEKITSMQEDTGCRVNKPVITDSVDLDRENRVIYYQIEGNNYQSHYSFDEGWSDYYLRWDHYIG